MNGIIKIVVITAISASLAGCSGTSGDSNTNASTASANTSNPANNAATNTNAVFIPYPGTENNNGIPANSDVKVVNIDPKQIKPANPAMSAPDNSEVLTVLNEKGAVETRTFKSHPVLAKMEKTTFGRDIKLKLYLKNGKVIDLPAEKIANFTTDSAAQILQAAGMQPPKPAQNPNTGAATGVKPQETTDSQPARPAQTPNAPPVKAPTKP